MEFHQQDAGRDFGIFVNLWQAFQRDPYAPERPKVAATLFLKWAEEPGGLVEPGILPGRSNGHWSAAGTVHGVERTAQSLY
jgi:hypothetical protein